MDQKMPPVGDRRRVGDIGFPASRIIGAGIEIAAAQEAASPFSQSEIQGRIKLKIEY